MRGKFFGANLPTCHRSVVGFEWIAHRNLKPQTLPIFLSLIQMHFSNSNNNEFSLKRDTGLVQAWTFILSGNAIGLSLVQPDWFHSTVGRWEVSVGTCIGWLDLELHYYISTHYTSEYVTYSPLLVVALVCHSMPTVKRWLAVLMHNSKLKAVLLLQSKNGNIQGSWTLNLTKNYIRTELEGFQRPRAF